jgi:hypothetical protein
MESHGTRDRYVRRYRDTGAAPLPFPAEDGDGIGDRTATAAWTECSRTLRGSGAAATAGTKKALSRNKGAAMNRRGER